MILSARRVIFEEQIMGEGLSVEDIAEELRIQRVGRLWAFSRDLREWETLKSCFHSDATIHVSWYSGPALGFVELSRQMSEPRRADEHHKHLLGNFRTAVRGRRAVHETDVLILIREFIDEYLFDYTAYGRFYDLFEKREGDWRIFSKTCIYDRDRLDAVVPGSVPRSFYDAVSIAGSGCGFAYMRFRQGKKGRTVPEGIVLGGSESEAALRDAGEHWLACG